MGGYSSGVTIARCTNTEINEASIERLVRLFMERAREEVLLGPIFNTAVSDWDHHISKIVNFWSSIVLKTGQHDGRPMRPGMKVERLLKGEHFDCRLALFDETAREIFSPAVSEAFLGRARLMADSFVMAITSSRGEIARLRHGDRKS